MPYRVITEVAKWEDVWAAKDDMDRAAVAAMVDSKLVDSADKVFTRWATGADLYSQFNGKTGVTLNVNNNKYVWSWDLSSASAGSEFTLLSIPSTVFTDITRTFCFKFIKFDELFPGVDEIRFYYRNIWGTSAYTSTAVKFGAQYIKIPKIVMSRTTQDLKITVIPNSYGAGSTLYMSLIGRIAVPVGTANEPNPKAFREMTL